MTKSILFLSIGFFIMSIIIIVNTQENSTVDIQQFETIFRKNLRDTFPSLVANLSKILQPLMGNNKTATVAIRVLDIVKEWFMQISSSPPPQKGSTEVSIPYPPENLVEEIIDIVVSFVVDGLVDVLKALLTPVIVLVQALLILVDAILNIVLWIVRALLLTLLTDIGLGDLGDLLTNILGFVQNLLDDLVSDLEKILGNLTIFSKT